MNEYDTLTVEHESILEYVAHGNQIRSRVQAIELNEQSRVRDKVW